MRFTIAPRRCSRIYLDGECLHFSVFQLLGDPLSTNGVDIGNDHPRTRRTKQVSCLPPDPARRTGHDGCPAGQINCHGHVSSILMIYVNTGPRAVLINLIAMPPVWRRQPVIARLGGSGPVVAANSA